MKYIFNVTLKSTSMKKIFIPILAAILLIGLCASGANEKTIANLKYAFKGESTASAKYAAYAEQAKKDGYPQVAVLFQAASKSEAIHAQNHKTVLEKLGSRPDPFKPEFTVKSTVENLKEAISGEHGEITAMYPGFIASAKDDNSMDAVRSFSWAMDTEKKHEEFYSAALNALNDKKVNTLPGIYWVCPKCGNTFNVATPEEKCPFCYTSRTKYFKFTV
jgi:rubrerythrin